MHCSRPLAHKAGVLLWIAWKNKALMVLKKEW